MFIITRIKKREYLLATCSDQMRTYGNRTIICKIQAYTLYANSKLILLKGNMQNRQKDEMVRDILAVTNGGSTITQIMFKAYLCHGQAKCYLGGLIAQGLMEYDSIDRKYRTSPKGLEYLQAAEKISEILTITTRRSVVGQK